jgi:hypothetical protein
MLRFESSDLEAYLRPSAIVDADHPAVAAQACLLTRPISGTTDRALYAGTSYARGAAVVGDSRLEPLTRGVDRKMSTSGDTLRELNSLRCILSSLQHRE